MNNEEFIVRRRGEAAKRLAISPDFKVFLEVIREQAQNIAHRVMIQGCDSFEDYLKLTGEYRGLYDVLTSAQQAADELDELMEPEDDQ